VIRILVVDDHPIVREGLVSVLGDEPGFAVVGSAASAQEAVDAAARHQPAIILLDLELPDRNGVEAIPLLLEVAPSARIIVFTAYATDERVLGAIKAGEKGYLLKGASAAEIARAVNVVHAGGSHLEPAIASKVLALVSAPRGSSPLLSERQIEVLRLVAQGLANKQIADALSISERTVKFHISTIFAKLDADNRAQAVAIAAERGLL
jgi:DNA-binding NarL/FixJ family response regulator